jgi:hypothetical protein
LCISKIESAAAEETAGTEGTSVAFATAVSVVEWFPKRDQIITTTPVTLDLLLLSSRKKGSNTSLMQLLIAHATLVDWFFVARIPKRLRRSCVVKVNGMKMHVAACCIAASQKNRCTASVGRLSRIRKSIVANVAHRCWTGRLKATGPNWMMRFNPISRASWGPSLFRA